MEFMPRSHNCPIRCNHLGITTRRFFFYKTDTEHCYVLVLASSCRQVLGHNIPCRRHIHSTNKTKVKSKFKYFKK